MLRTAVAVGLLGGSIAVVLAGGYALHSANRDRVVDHFQQLELHTAEEVAALLDMQLAGAARTLRAVAAAAAVPVAPNARFVDELFSEQDRCPGVPCFTSLALVAADGARRQAIGRPLTLSDRELADGTAWARDIEHARDVRATISTSQAPSLLLFTPLRARQPANTTYQGVVAAQIALDALLAGQRRPPGPGWPQYQTLVLKADGTVMFHSHQAEMRLNNIYERSARCLGCHESFDHVKRMLAIEHGMLAYRVQNVDQVAAMAPFTFEGERWIVVITVPRDHVTGFLSAEVWQLSIVMIMVISLVVAGGSITWRNSRRRLLAEAEARQKAHLARSHGELTLMNAKLEHAAHEWRMTVDTIDAALLLLEPTGEILRMNLAAAATLSGDLASWLGRPSVHLLGVQPWNAALALVGEAVDRQVVVTAHVRDPKDGRTWDLWCRALASRQRPAVLILARDVTAVVELQESVRRSETMAALGSIVVGVAHEVRNPLFAISSLVDAWSVQPLRDPRPFVDGLKSEVERLGTLMTDLLEYGRPAKRTRLAQRLKPVVDAAVRACMHEAVARRVRIATVVRGDAEVLMDARRLERVFINVIQNAVQHAPEDSTVRVELSAPAATDPTRAEVTVRDSGPGFAPDDLPRIFTPFFSRRAGGFGLGLAITERIAIEHQGQVTARNDPEGGGVMTVSLPTVHRRPETAAQSVESRA